MEKRKGGGDITCKVKEIEKRLEIRDREERRRNVVIRGVAVKREGRRKAVEEIIKIIGMKEMKEIKKIGGQAENGREMLLVKLGSEEQKREVMGRKSKLKGREERISEDLSWKERKMKWKLEEIARVEERRGRRIWVEEGE